ncbi:MAG: hypothetical protein ACOX34_06795 [Bacillota bacterium]
MRTFHKVLTLEGEVEYIFAGTEDNPDEDANGTEENPDEGDVP